MLFPRFESAASILVLSAAFSSFGSAAGQTSPPPENRRLEIRANPIAPAPPQPRAGDAIRTGPDGEIVVEWKDASGKTMNGQVPRRNRVSPEVAAETRLTEERKVIYSYTVANRPGARQDIVQFVLSVSRPDLLTSPTSPANWWRPGPSPDIPRWHWGSKLRMSDIRPGQSTGPFRFESPLLPGLVDAYFEGYLSVEEAASGPSGSDLSVWLALKLSEALRLENNSASVKSIGPKFDVTSTMTRDQFANAVADELLTASRMPEFEELRAFLEDTSSILKNARRIASETHRRMRQMGGTLLQRSFLQAMALNLEYLEKLP